MKLQIKLNHSVRTSSSCSSSASSPTSTSPRKKFGLPKLYLGDSASTREHSEGEHLHHEGSAGSCATSTPMSTARQEVIGNLSPMLSKGYGVEDLEGVRMKGIPAGTSLQELEEVFAQLNANGDGKISAEELRSVLSSLGEDAAVTDEEEMATAFAIFDLRKDGRIRAKDIEHLRSIEDCRRMISSIDRKGLGHVDYDNFKRIMTPLVLP
ncbi:hypothetical protein KP509_1Z059300 [Ceratopteris richardii]|nr:hypothetical protein KP509_1Z059200 [Ceratopteris richardii]KAH6558519.1 hypothetical protein KP509_1Z059300 [Ceratopteris richardii]